MINKIFLRLFIISALATFGLASDTAKKVYVARRTNPHAPIIDGRLDEAAWEKADWQGDFTQRQPHDGAEPSQETAFKILYDSKNLYVGIRAYDTEPEEIVKRVTRRDRFEGDWVEINIDSYFDHRSGFSFTINAAGVKGDEYIS
ncbi:hydrolase, partial [candidate division KSB1 bacterium]|nr:hydrolase [candidate division KSB1 bacterium]